MGYTHGCSASPRTERLLFDCASGALERLVTVLHIWGQMKLHSGTALGSDPPVETVSSETPPKKQQKEKNTGSADHIILQKQRPGRSQEFILFWRVRESISRAVKQASSPAALFVEQKAVKVQKHQSVQINKQDLKLCYQLVSHHNSLHKI